ncbi:MAG TPA: hypothetical protein VFY90_12385 [Tepidiformaceae bacterium]|nr:hypothetical protein [Tepidiformaceae bacterium]
MALADYRTKTHAEAGSLDWRTGRPSLSRRAKTLWLALGINRGGLEAVLPAGWAVGIPVLVLATIVAGSLLEPAPAVDETGAVAVMEGTISAVLTIGFVATLAGALSLRRWGIATAFAVAVFSLALVLSCPLSGHHTFGAWWLGEITCVMAATGIAGYGMIRTNGRPD